MSMHDVVVVFVTIVVMILLASPMIILWLFVVNKILSWLFENFYF